MLGGIRFVFCHWEPPPHKKERLSRGTIMKKERQKMRQGDGKDCARRKAIGGVRGLAKFEPDCVQTWGGKKNPSARQTPNPGRSEARSPESPVQSRGKWLWRSHTDVLLGILSGESGQEKKKTENHSGGLIGLMKGAHG